MGELRWVSVDARTGGKACFLPGFEPNWPLTDTLCAAESASGLLNLDQAPAIWPEAVRGGGSVLACYYDDDPNRTIVWGGLVLDAPRDTDDNAAVVVTLVTILGYAGCRYTRDLEYDGVGQNDIVVDLATRYLMDADLPGMPFTVRVVPEGDPGPARSVVWQNTDNATVLDRFDALAAVENGIEFAGEWEWSDDFSTLTPVLLVGSRLGVDPPAGRGPQMVFRMPGNVIRAQRGDSWANGDGANVVEAIGPGQGDAATPTSGLLAVTDFAGRPAFEYRCDPQEVASQDDLDAVALATLGMLANGKSPVALSAILDDTAKLWGLGDTVGYQVGGIDPQTGKDTVPEFPGGIAGLERVWSRQISKDPSGAPTVTPVFKAPVLPADQTETVGG